REPLAARARVADRFWLRARGLLARPALADGEGLVIRPCRAVHTWGMRYPIDIAFLDPAGRVVASYEDVRPNRRTRWHAGADCALELPAGSLARAAVTVGDRISWEEASA
ncbi:MAG TPA: DUF192 domain-containing protein, partial [Gemmatimonadales bacterium]|nr:DUF192 domain-containing protein [Gemmatimonadales bacterium]